MQHLSEEALARLIDEAPTELERLHLSGCDRCAAELEALREQTRALAGLPALSAPEHAWPALESRLAEEGLIGWRQSPVRRRSPAGTLLRAAAYVGLFLLGGFAGRELGRGETAGGEALADGGRTAAVAPAAEAEEIVQRLRDAEATYVNALSHYAELVPDEGADPVARLAALEGIVLTTRAALQDAPADPVINGYHLTAMGQREAVLRQIARSADDPWF